MNVNILICMAINLINIVSKKIVIKKIHHQFHKVAACLYEIRTARTYV